MILYDRNGGDMAVNVTVGNGMGCALRVQLFDQDGHPAPSGPHGVIFESWTDDDLEPEYVIPAAALAANSRLFILHTYSAAPIVAGKFRAISEFVQNVETQAEVVTSQTGGDVYHRIVLRAAP